MTPRAIISKPASNAAVEGEDMSEVSEQAKVKACELMAEDGLGLARYIQAVSDALKDTFSGKAIAIGREYWAEKLSPFILPDPVDPLELAGRAVIEKHRAGGADADAIGGDRLFLHDLATELAARGLKIVESA